MQKYSYLLYLICENSKYLKINSASPLYLVINKVNEYFEESNKNNYLTLVPPNKSKEIKKRKIL